MVLDDKKMIIKLDNSSKQIRTIVITKKSSKYNIVTDYLNN